MTGERENVNPLDCGACAEHYFDSPNLIGSSPCPTVSILADSLGVDTGGT